MRTIAIIGASLAGLRSAQALRRQGYDGRIVFIGDEVHLPYDRPPLSKDFLLGKVEAVPLADQEDLDAIDADWRLGVQATALLSTQEIALSDGTTVEADGVVIATGGIPRTIPNTHVLRTLDDALKLREAFADARSVGVIGAGFIGAEIASSARSLGKDVTVVEALPAPLMRVLGAEMGHAVGQLHGDHGSTLITGVNVDSVNVDGGINLADGRKVDADVVVAGIGVRPATDWLAGGPVKVDNGVVCDAGGVTNVKTIVAVGDVANCAGHRAEHWTSATEQAQVATRNLLAGETVATHTNGGYVWSDQYGARIQFIGRATRDVRVEDGSIEDRKFVATYRDGENGEDVVGIVAMSNAKLFTRLRRSLS
ncbi:NADPH-dependent 2,4-dienoyl-CoA reductase, sulfur reductase [Lentzea fradiae]|uniref:NADPH-dependent 2,4-dienoyl-CoA reductase, sulfur reductase n=1 Tax=Lentzea fradiae TaxID=200378 RepID=A0A1G7XNF2_9PSEU|nr:FAD-dependent oxidoreductase [Lentzea fradiae]SDG85735.1 NADPH-dependent 2,4-dienoyl-CoA reductase, sulfur reductase [Lentzea fradiae]